MKRIPITLTELAMADDLIARLAMKHGVRAEDVKISLWCLWFANESIPDNTAVSWIGKQTREIRARYDVLLQTDPDRAVEKATQEAQISLLELGLQFKDGILYRFD